MSTSAHEVTWYIARGWESIYPSAVLSGIVGDEAHQKGGGYHISIENNSSTNYSVIRPDDKAPPGDWPRYLAAAIDMSMSTQDMALCFDRLWWAWNDLSDPRRIYINGFNGWDGKTSEAKRYDFVTQKISTTTSDHKWHTHLEERRKYVTSMFAANAILSILRGESKEQYIASLSGGGIEDMFCKFGDGEHPNTPSMAVAAMQRQLERIEPGCLSAFGGPDGRYGNGTATTLGRLVTGTDRCDDYNGDVWELMQFKYQSVLNTGGGGTLPPAVTVTGSLVIPEMIIPATTVPVTGIMEVQK